MKDSDTNLKANYSSWLHTLSVHETVFYMETESWDLTISLWHCRPLWRDTNLELFRQGLPFAGCVSACHREEVSLKQDFVGKSWAHSWLMCALQHEQSYQKLLVRLDKKLEELVCWSVIHFSQMMYGPETFQNEMETKIAQWISHILIIIIPNSSCFCFHRMYEC